MNSDPTWDPAKCGARWGGAVDAGESQEEAARRESTEEGGLDTIGAKKLPGVSINNDRMYYVMQESDNWGMQIFALEIPFSLLRQDLEDRHVIEKGRISHSKESDLYFLPWKKAVLISADALALAGIARLLREVL